MLTTNQPTPLNTPNFLINTILPTGMYKLVPIATATKTEIISAPLGLKRAKKSIIHLILCYLMVNVNMSP